jgi:hypothetical protein
MLGVFAKFEREMIIQRVGAGVDRVRGEIERKGHCANKKDTTIKRFGRPGAEPHWLNRQSSTSPRVRAS